MDDGIYPVKSLDKLTIDMRHDALFVYDNAQTRGGPKQVSNALHGGGSGLDVFARDGEDCRTSPTDDTFIIRYSTPGRVALRKHRGWDRSVRYDAT